MAHIATPDDDPDRSSSWRLLAEQFNVNIRRWLGPQLADINAAMAGVARSNLPEVRAAVEAARRALEGGDANEIRSAMAAALLAVQENRLRYGRAHADLGGLRAEARGTVDGSAAAAYLRGLRAEARATVYRDAAAISAAVPEGTDPAEVARSVQQLTGAVEQLGTAVEQASPAAAHGWTIDRALAVLAVLVAILSFLRDAVADGWDGDDPVPPPAQVTVVVEQEIPAGELERLVEEQVRELLDQKVGKGVAAEAEEEAS